MHCHLSTTSDGDIVETSVSLTLFCSRFSGKTGLKGALPPLKFSSLSPFKGRGIKGEGLDKQIPLFGEKRAGNFLLPACIFNLIVV